VDVKDKVNTVDVKDKVNTVDVKDKVNTVDVKDKVNTVDVKEDVESLMVKEDVVVNFYTLPHKIPTSSIGVVLTRKVTNQNTNNYWNENISQLNKLYGNSISIIIIDDNSNQKLLKTWESNKHLTNVYAIKNPAHLWGRGEILPYYYVWHFKLITKAVLVIHDSTFLQTKIDIGKKASEHHAIPLWHFEKERENAGRVLYYLKNLTNNQNLLKKYTSNRYSWQYRWMGCFGVQSIMSMPFLNAMFSKYNLDRLLKIVKNRPDRCCLERVFGLIISCERNPKSISLQPSLFGDIQRIGIWGYTYHRYMNTKNTKPFLLPKYVRNIVKVWTGR